MDEKALHEMMDDMIRMVEQRKNEIMEINDAALKKQTELVRELAKMEALAKEYATQGDADPNRIKQLKQQCKDQNKQINKLNKTIDCATHLGRKTTVALTYLDDDFSFVNKALKTSKERHQLGLQIMDAQEMERKRLSREIHDGLAQMLANILIRSEFVDLSCRRGNHEQAQEEVKVIQENIRTSLSEVRRIIYDLRPMALDDLGLIPTIKKYVVKMAELHQVEIDLTCTDKKERLEKNYEVAVFRLVQEAVQNAIKHANASSIHVIVEIIRGKIKVVIKDDGIGFDQDAIDKQSFGLIGMKERVEILNGKMLVRSEKGKGTIIRIFIPYILK